MKRNNLTTAVVAGIAGVAGLVNISSAVNLNPDGLGEVLVYPYYTVNGGNTTLVSIVNTTATGKAVKVRFLEGRNSREVLDFNLYLSEFDVWVAAVFATDATGAAVIRTTDRTCTVPAIPAAGQAFRNFQYAGTNNASDGGPQGLDRTREGHLEMIEMGALIDNSASDRAITHSQSTQTPASCATVLGAWSPGTGYWTLNSAVDLNLSPLSRGGLFGAGAIIDVAEGTMLAYNADAIDNFSQNNNPALHSAPGSTLPSLAQAGDILTGIAQSVTFDSDVTPSGVVISDYPLTRAIDAVSAVYMHENIYNEYNTETAIGANSEWVVTFPTKRFYVDRAITPTPIIPFSRSFVGTSCVDISIAPYNREETRPGPGGVDFSPPPPGAVGPQFCFEAQVVSFSQPIVAGTTGPSRILGSMLTSNIDLASFQFQTGWVDINLDVLSTTAVPVTPRTRASIDGDVFEGQPITGFWAWQVVNSNVTAGVLANYSGLFRHRATTTCLNGLANCS